MFGMGLWEILAIAFVAVVFLKPEDLPGFARRLGKFSKQVSDFYRSLRRMASDIETEIKKPLVAYPESQQKEPGVERSGPQNVPLYGVKDPSSTDTGNDNQQQKVQNIHQRGES